MLLKLRLAEAFGKKEVREYEAEREDEDLEKKVHDMAYDKVMLLQKLDLLKHERTAAFTEIKEELKLLFLKKN